MRALSFPSSLPLAVSSSLVPLTVSASRSRAISLSLKGRNLLAEEGRESKRVASEARREEERSFLSLLPAPFDYHCSFACISCLTLTFLRYSSTFGFLTSFLHRPLFFSSPPPLSPLLPPHRIALLSSLRPYLAIEIRACHTLTHTRTHTRLRGASPSVLLSLSRPLVSIVSLNRVVFALHVAFTLHAFFASPCSRAPRPSLSFPLSFFLSLSLSLLAFL